MPYVRDLDTDEAAAELVTAALAGAPHDPSRGKLSTWLVVGKRAVKPVGTGPAGAA